MSFSSDVQKRWSFIIKVIQAQIVFQSDLNTKTNTTPPELEPTHQLY